MIGINCWALDTHHSGDFLLFLKGPLTPPYLKSFHANFWS
jgi:hypothetical protein